MAVEAVLTALASGRVSSEELTRLALARIEDPEGEGQRTFVRVFRDTALREARQADLSRMGRRPRGQLAGVPVSVKDLFDVAGHPTTAGSKVLRDAPVATADSDVVRRLRAEGAVITGHTSMTEFAFSGLGLNPHYGTPANPHRRPERRIPGGSSSGAAVSVADGMSVAAVGTDTGGSIRIPAALCGLAGFKPSVGRVSHGGLLPLSTTLDSVGVIARSVACCRTVFNVLATFPTLAMRRRSLGNARVLAPTNYLRSGMDSEVADAYESALGTLRDAGAEVVEAPAPVLDKLAEAMRLAAFPAVEGFAWHRELLEQRGALYDPRVRVRLERGGHVLAADYIKLVDARARLIVEAGGLMRGFDFMVSPTTPVVAPRIADLEGDEDLYHATNLLMLRNPTVVNFLGGCAVSIPCQRQGRLPVGLSLARFDSDDSALLDWAQLVEGLVSGTGND